jgi:hypothetical protein
MLPKNLRELTREVAAANPPWGEEGIADELLLKLGIHVSPRTVGKYLDSLPPRGRTSNQRWSTFVQNHAKGIVACDFMVSVTASMRVLYVFVAMEIGSRRILRTNVTAHPTAEWTLQQFRECLAFDHSYKFVIHDRTAIFSTNLDSELKGFCLRVLKTPVRAPKTNAAAHTPRWGQESRSHLKPRIRSPCIDINSRPGVASHRRPSSARYITNIDWRGRLRDWRRSFCSPHAGHPIVTALPRD